MLYLAFLFGLVFFRFSCELTDGKPWYRKSDHSYHFWDEPPYDWTNMLARALTGLGIVFCVAGWLTVIMTYQYGQPLRYHLSEVFKWSLLAGVLDVVYCIAYNIWLRQNRPGVIGLAYDWEGQSRIPNPMAKADRVFRRQKRQMSRARRKAMTLLKSRHGASGNKNASNPKYRHRY